MERSKPHKFPLPLAGEGQGGGLQITLCGPEAAADVHRLTQQAFRDYGDLDPPSGALKETEALVAKDLARAGGAIARMNGRAVGCLRFERDPESLHVRRLAVEPSKQRRGIGKTLMLWVHEYAAKRGFNEVRIGVRPQLTGNLAFYRKLGYRVIEEHRHPGYNRTTWIEMGITV